MPRRTKLTPEVQKIIVDALTLGATHRVAFEFAGVSHESFYNWLEKGAQDRKPYSDFLEAVTRAQTRAVVGLLAKIERAATAGDWRAAAWKLERRWPEEWGPKERVDVRLTVVKEALEKVALDIGMASADVLAEAQALLSERASP